MVEPPQVIVEDCNGVEGEVVEDATENGDDG